MRRFPLIRACLLALVLLVGWTRQASALTVYYDPDATLSAQVTAIVPDRMPPSVPILIKPDNGSTITTPKPPFQWIGSTDNVGISHYELWLNGELLYDTILPESITTDQFQLVYDPIANTFILTPATNLPDGVYTWQVIAVDTSGNRTVSATWTFIIDTTAPLLVISTIDGQEVNIRSDNANSLPTEPIVISTPSPLITGFTEPGSSLQVVISINGQEERFALQVAADGSWALQLNNLPADTVITLTFISTDQFGHTTIIQPVLLLYTVVAPITSVSPTRKPLLPVATPSPLPGLVVSPYPTPIDGAPLIGALTRSMSAAEIAPSILKIVRDATNWSGLSVVNVLVLISPTLLAIALLAYKIGWLTQGWSWKLLFWVIGWRGRFVRDGRVFDQASLDGVWLTTVLLVEVDSAVTSTAKKRVYYTITNKDGFFILPFLDSASYQLKPIGEHLLYPSMTKRTNDQPWNRYYQNDTVYKSEGKALPYIEIPVDILKQRSKFAREVVNASHWRGWLINVQLVLMVLVILLSPSIINIMALPILGGLVLWSRDKEGRSKYDQYLGLQ